MSSAAALADPKSSPFEFFVSLGELRKLKIEPSLVDPKEVEVLEDLIVAAVNDARAKADAVAAEQMKQLTGGLNLPPGMTLPF